MLLQPDQEYPMRFDLNHPAFVSHGLGSRARMITVVAQAQRGTLQLKEDAADKNRCATRCSSNTLESLILLCCEQVRVDCIGTSIHGLRSFDKNDYFLNGTDNNGRNQGDSDNSGRNQGNLEHDEDRRIIATRTPSLICQVRSRREQDYSSSPPIILENETDFALLFVICDPRRIHKKDTVLWREVALPHGSLAYPLHLSSNRHFILKMIPCVSPACTDPIPGAKYHVVPFLQMTQV